MNSNTLTVSRQHLIDTHIVMQAVNLLTTPGQVVEVRALEATDRPNSQYKNTLSGYFNNPDQLARSLEGIHSAKGIYITLQPCHAELIHREASNELKRAGRDSSTSDSHITGYRWLLIDSDPERISGTSSSDQEHEQALAHSLSIRDALRGLGWPEPVIADSGNGAHLLYRIDLPTSESELVRRVLEGLANRYSTDLIKVDRTVFNPSRICKLYGTLACKGANTLQRPHRMSRLLEVPEDLQIVSRELLEAITPPAQPEPTPRAQARIQNTSFNLTAWIQEHHIAARAPVAWNGGTKWILDECPFCKEKDGGAVLLQMSSGAADFKCQHNRCSSKGWSDFRQYHEPTAYTAKEKKAATDEKPARPGLDEVADEFAAKYRAAWAYNARSGAWYQWTGKYWRDMQEDEAQKKSCTSLDKLVKQLMQNRGMSINRSSDLDCVIRLAAIDCRRVFSPKRDLVNFHNGTLDLATMQLLPHNRDDGITYCLPYDYTPEQEHPVIDAFLSEAIPDAHARQAYIAHVGLSLIGDMRMHYAAMLYGPKRAGKSTLLDLANVTCGVERGDYAGYTLFAPDLEGKRTRYKRNKQRVVCIDELPVEALRHEETVKNMTAHSGAEMRGIGRDEESDNRWRPKLFLAMNEKPHYKDTSGAIKERLIPVLVPNTREKGQRDLHLFDKMRNEIGSFAARCIRYALAALARGYYPTSAEMNQVMYELETIANPLKAFLQEHCILEPGAQVLIDELYAAYKEYCGASGNSALGKAKMSNALTEMGKGITHKRIRDGQVIKRGLQGIRLRELGDPQPEENVQESDNLLVNESVYDVYDTCTTLSDDRTQPEAAPEAAPLGSVYDVYDTLAKSCLENTQKEEMSGINTIKDKKQELSYTSYTDAIEPPVESAEPVYDSVYDTSPDRTHRTQNESLLAELRGLYQEIQRLQPQKLAPHGQLLWFVPGSGYDTGMVTPTEWGKRLQACCKSGDEKRMNAARDEMLKKLGKVSA